MIQNLLCIFGWLVSWHLYHQTMFKTHLTNLLLWFTSIWKWCIWSFGPIRGQLCWEVPCQCSKRYTSISNRFLEYVSSQRWRASNNKWWRWGLAQRVTSTCFCLSFCVLEVSWSVTKRRKLLSGWEFYKMKVATNLLHKEEDTLIATSISSELSMTSQIVKELII